MRFKDYKPRRVLKERRGLPFVTIQPDGRMNFNLPAVATFGLSALDGHFARLLYDTDTRTLAMVLLSEKRKGLHLFKFRAERSRASLCATGFLRLFKLLPGDLLHLPVTRDEQGRLLFTFPSPTKESNDEADADTEPK